MGLSLKSLSRFSEYMRKSLHKIENSGNLWKFWDFSTCYFSYVWDYKAVLRGGKYTSFSPIKTRFQYHFGIIPNWSTKSVLKIPVLHRHTGKPGPRTLMGPYINRKTRTLAGPYKNQKTGIRDLSGTLKNRELIITAFLLRYAK